jgi:anti-anti-sigma factor
MDRPFVSEPSFVVSIERIGGDHAVVFRGELDMCATDALWRCIEQIRSSGRPLVIDLAETTFMDSSGIDLLLKAYRAQGQTPEAVVLRSPSDAVRQTLALTGITDVFLTDDRAGADAEGATT